MQSKRFYQFESTKKLALCTLSLVLLFFGFFSNSWNVAEQKRFESNQSGSECLIVGRLIKSRQDGIFSAGGLTGAWVPDNSPKHGISERWLPTHQARNQYSAYFNGISFDTYSPYMSQTGGQGMLFSLLDSLIPLSAQTKLALFHTLTSLLSASALTVIILWLYCELGLSAALFAACSMVLSQSLTDFGRDLWWSMWAFYLPMIALMYFFKNKRTQLDNHFIWFGLLCFIAVSIKCFINGYEYITTTLIMMIIPFVYYSMRDRVRVSYFFTGISIATLGSLLAIFLNLIILSFQVGAAKGDVQDGFEHIVYVFEKRTHGDTHDYPDSTDSTLEAGTIMVVVRYLSGSFFDLNNYLTVSNQFISRYLFKVRYLYLIIFFLGMSLVVLYSADKNTPSKQQQRNRAFVCTTWVSILAPLSWIIIFKAHSFVHAGMNFIVWQMPFTVFGSAVCGLAAKNLLPGTMSKCKPEPDLVYKTKHKSTE